MVTSSACGGKFLKYNAKWGQRTNFRKRRKIFSLIDYSDSEGKVVSINQATDLAIFSVFCVLSG
jgi:hypothetical protein